MHSGTGADYKVIEKDHAISSSDSICLLWLSAIDVPTPCEDFGRSVLRKCFATFPVGDSDAAPVVGLVMLAASRSKVEIHHSPRRRGRWNQSRGCSHPRTWVTCCSVVAVVLHLVQRKVHCRLQYHTQCLLLALPTTKSARGSCDYFCGWHLLLRFKLARSCAFSR